MFGKNWKTSLGGLGMILAGLGGLVNCVMGLLGGHPDVAAGATPAPHVGTMECFTVSLGLISGGAALLKAKDHDVTGGATPQTKVAALQTGDSPIGLPGPVPLSPTTPVVVPKGV